MTRLCYIEGMSNTFNPSRHRVTRTEVVPNDAGRWFVRRWYTGNPVTDFRGERADVRVFDREDEARQFAYEQPCSHLEEMAGVGERGSIAYCHEHNLWWERTGEGRWLPVSGAAGKRMTETAQEVYFLTLVPNNYAGAGHQDRVVTTWPMGPKGQ